MSQTAALPHYKSQWPPNIWKEKSINEIVVLQYINLNWQNDKCTDNRYIVLKYKYSIVLSLLCSHEKILWLCEYYTVPSWRALISKIARLGWLSTHQWPMLMNTQPSELDLSGRRTATIPLHDGTQMEKQLECSTDLALTSGATKTPMLKVYLTVWTRVISTISVLKHILWLQASLQGIMYIFNKQAFFLVISFSNNSLQSNNNTRDDRFQFVEFCHYL